jgi:DNA-binding transcriptional MerR regulator
MAATTDATPRLLTIGTVCRLLKDEFPDISISKIRYLEDRGLLAPRRTQGGYRLFGEDDVERLETILRLQRDEFLPLNVIRRELAAPGTKDRARRRFTAQGADEPEPELELSELCERAGVDGRQVRELEEFGLLQPQTSNGRKLYDEVDADIAAACGQLARFGLDPRHLRTFRTAAERQVGLVDAIVAPALRARNPERRRSGLENLELLGAQAQELMQLLFLRALRKLAE